MGELTQAQKEQLAEANDEILLEMLQEHSNENGMGRTISIMLEMIGTVLRPAMDEASSGQVVDHLSSGIIVTFELNLSDKERKERANGTH